MKPCILPIGSPAETIRRDRERCGRRPGEVAVRDLVTPDHIIAGKETGTVGRMAAAEKTVKTAATSGRIQHHAVTGNKRSARLRNPDRMAGVGPTIVAAARVGRGATAETARTRPQPRNRRNPMTGFSDDHCQAGKTSPSSVLVMLDRLVDSHERQAMPRKRERV